MGAAEAALPDGAATTPYERGAVLEGLCEHLDTQTVFVGDVE